MSQDPNGIQIDRMHTGAICNEIGERLRATLRRNPNRLSLHILSLTERFDSVERGNTAFKASIAMDEK
ncbi:MAG: hypothetical protein WCA28_25500 [Bradyrhizobium sp.]